ncbi:Response regulator with putative antiterminator output domain [Variovorax sp. HW608]|uniref:nitrate regulatory protein n=1 Tax=Variovorax sp. HW608 TaxID=1034889 RepID=UPI000820209D|nr:nitrate regulatory protein [Variovorax sp. HW608]SCK48034.1 Response regulator with putative antiterminator output domain [Variovorax sp. HW608]
MKSGLDFLIAALRCEIEGLEQLARTSELVGTIGRLVHALQRERGISNVLLVSRGQRFAEQHREQIAASQRMEAAVLESFEQLAAQNRIGNGARLFSRIAWVLPGLGTLPELRRRIGALEIDAAESTAAFVKLIAGLLAVVFEAADGATDPEISRVLVALFNFMQGKEFAGQERACGAAAFASGRNDGARQQQWLHLIDSQERCFKVFVSFSNAALAELWRANQPPGQIAELERLRRIACAAPAGVALDPELSPLWFDCCTRRIDAMQAVEERLADRLRRVCRQKMAEVRNELAAHEALQHQLADARDPPGAAFFESHGLAEPAAGDAAPYGRQLERSILDMVQEQSHRLQAMSDELETVRAALNERKVVERAKGLLMAHRRISEQEAHKMLRQTAMNQGRRLIDVAESVLAMAELLPRNAAP